MERHGRKVASAERGEHIGVEVGEGADLVFEKCCDAALDGNRSQKFEQGTRAASVQKLNVSPKPQVTQSGCVSVVGDRVNAEVVGREDGELLRVEARRTGDVARFAIVESAYRIHRPHPKPACETAASAVLSYRLLPGSSFRRFFARPLVHSGGRALSSGGPVIGWPPARESRFELREKASRRD